MSDGSIPPCGTQKDDDTKLNQNDMTTRDFEQAIGRLSVPGLNVTKVSYGVNGQVVAVYGMQESGQGRGGAANAAPTFLKWDMNGRGFRFDPSPDGEGCISTGHAEYLDYQRDEVFDLKFE